jgi:carbonic anhydrase
VDVRSTFLLILSAAVQLAECGGGASVQPPPASLGNGQHHAHWAYSGDEGPEHWGALDPSFGACRGGIEQTPIDLPASATPAQLPELVFSYAPTPLAILNNGHTVQAKATGESTLSLGGETYTLVQMHAHAPSEHTIAGQHTDLELHLVHKNARGALAVVGILFRRGEPSRVLAPWFDAAPSEVTVDAKSIDATLHLEQLVPRDPGYDTYPGSLTTPPCSEGVRWFVLLDPMQASQAQIEHFIAATGGGVTNRPVQPVGTRVVTTHAGSPR